MFTSLLLQASGAAGSATVEWLILSQTSLIQ